MLKVLDSFKLTIPSDMPFSDIPSILNQDQLKIWNKERNKWDNTHTERKFLPEFYDSFDILSQEAIAKKSKIDSNLEMSSAHGLTVDGDNLIIYLWIDPNLPQEIQDGLADKVNDTGKIIDVLAEALNECDVKCIYPRNIDLKLYRVVMEG